MMSKREQPPNADHRTAFIVHDQLVDRSLQAVNLFLDFCYDLLNLLHSRLGVRRGQIDTQTEKHHCKRSDFRCEILLLDLEEGNDAVRHAAHQFTFDALEDF